MDRYEQAALLDFVLTVIWPTRTVIIATASQTAFTINGTWNTSLDTPMAWSNGNRITSGVSFAGPSTVTLPAQTAGAQVIIFVSPGAGTGYLPRLGGAAMLGALDMGNNRVSNMGPSLEADDAVRRDEVIAIVSAIVGANYVLKSGSQMTGPLLLSTAAGLTDPAAAVRRDMVALLNGTQPFVAEQRGVAATDPAGLVTKAQMETAVAGAGAPHGVLIVTAAGANTWTVPAGVQLAHALLVGGGGGGGGDTSGSPSRGAGGGGGGHVRAVTFRCTPGAILPYIVGAGGARGLSDNDGSPGSSTVLTLPGLAITAPGGEGGLGTDGNPVPLGGAPNGGAGGYFDGFLSHDSEAGGGTWGTPGGTVADDRNGGGGGVPDIPEAYMLTAAGLPSPVGGAGGIESPSTDAQPGLYGGGGGGGPNGSAANGAAGGAGFLVVIW